MRRSALILVVALVAVSCGGDGSDETTTQAPATKLRPGSVLHFVVEPRALERPGMELLSVLTETQRVAQDGTILVPYAGDVPVAGLTRAEVDEVVKAKLGELFIDPVILHARFQPARAR